MFAMDEEAEFEQPAVQQKTQLAQVPAQSASVKSFGRKEKNNIVNFQSPQKVALQMKVVEPQSYDDAKMITDHLHHKRGVVVNLHLVNEVQLRRILDFVYGYIYATNGDIQKIGANIYLCTPDTVEISGTISAFDTEERSNYVR